MGRFRPAQDASHAGFAATLAELRAGRKRTHGICYGPGGLEISRDRLRVAGVMHRKSADERIDFFLSYRFENEQPRNVEPQKCSEVIWAKVSALPSDTIPYVREALETFPGDGWFREFGWDAGAEERPM